MVNEASTIFHKTIAFEQVKSDMLANLWPMNPQSTCWEYLLPHEGRYQSFLEQFLFTTIVRYADYQANFDVQGEYRKKLGHIMCDNRVSINQKIHALFYMAYPPSQFIEEGLRDKLAIIPTGDTLDIPEEFAVVVARKSLGLANKFNAMPYVESTGLEKTSCPPADTLIFGILLRFSTDIAMTETKQDLRESKRLLQPLIGVPFPKEEIIDRLAQLTQFINSRIAQL